ncbi:MAG: DNA repair protein RecN [Gracilibacteraceae bacterium]|nr:DNA repair protein RecN [Gracilibacteraceae bacterium]
MLTELNIRDFGLMENIHLELEGGFSVFTGETGAGKSMLIDALSLLLGGRASADIIRHGREKTNVEGIFSALPPQTSAFLAEEGYPLEDGLLFLAREINASGRNICRVQGHTVPLSLYKTFCADLVDIHGQAEHQSLLRPEYHRELLDNFGGAEHLGLVAAVRECALRYRELAAKERGMLQLEGDIARQQDFLRYQIKEIEKVAPAVGEEENLEQEKKLLVNEERIHFLADEIYAALYDAPDRQGVTALDLLSRADKALSELSGIDRGLAETAAALNELYFALDDIAAQIRSYRGGLSFETGRLDKIETRLMSLQKLRKYGATAAEVIKKKKEMKEKLEELSLRQGEKESLRLSKNDARSAFSHLAEELSLKRGIVADRLEKGLAGEFAGLGMDGARVEVIFTPVVDPAPHGGEQIEFYFSANVGEPPRPLAKIASGGEMARIMLAFKSLLAQVETVDTFVFDEVDSGVGGVTVHNLAEKLTRIAAAKQVLCITHNARVAASASAHYAIAKNVRQERTITGVRKLTKTERVREIARMMGGDEAARRMAEQLMPLEAEVFKE